MQHQAISIQSINVQKAFKDTTALNGVSLNFSAGRLHGLIGPEGAGKTTLFRILIGLLKANHGEIRYTRETETVALDDVRTQIAYMPQTQSLYADLSVIEHLEFFRALYQIPKDHYLAKVEELLHITRLKSFTNRPAGKLSGGMYKKLGLMCSLLRSPSVVLLDEPTNGVDPISRREFWDLLYELVRHEITVVVATAYMDEAERCSLVHILEKGEVLDTGEPQEILQKNDVDSFDTLFLKRGKREMQS